MRDLPIAADQQFGVFTTEQAVKAGWSRDQLRYAVDTGGLLRVRRGVFALPADEGMGTYAQQARRLGQLGVAAALRIPDAAVSHSAALAVHGLPLFHPPQIPCVTKPQSCRTLQHQLHLHRKKLGPLFLEAGMGFAITSVARTCIDVACEQGLAAGVIAADAALREGRTNLDALFTARRSIRGDPGSPTAGRLLDIVDARAESPLESLSRVSLLDVVPPPLVQAEVFTPGGAFIGRVDLLWEIPGVIGEADGAGKYDEFPGTLSKEKWRQDRLNETDAVIARWGWDLAQSPRRLAAYLETRFEEAWRRRAAGIRPKWIVRPT